MNNGRSSIWYKIAAMLMISVMVMGTVSGMGCFAKAAEAYMVTFLTAGKNVNSLPEDFTVEDDTFTVPANPRPWRVGFVCMGYTTCKNNTSYEENYENVRTVEYRLGKSYPITENLMLYPVWKTSNEYAVTFLTAGKNVNNLPEDIIVEASNPIVTIPSDLPLRNGFVCVGYTTNKDDTSYEQAHNRAREVMYKPGETYSFDGDTALYPVWKGNKDSFREYTVAFSDRGNKNLTNLPSDYVVLANSEFTIPSIIPEWDDLVFEGYNPLDCLSEGIYTIGDSCSIDEDIILYPVWGGFGEIRRIELSGRKEDYLTTTDYCYTEGDRCILLFEKGVRIPGDIADKTDLIIEELERQLDYSFDVPNVRTCDSSTCRLGFNPWKYLDRGGKVEILFCNYGNEIGGTGGTDSGVTINNRHLFSVYKDENGVEHEYINYFVIAHELTHTLTFRYAYLTQIMTEGGADYFGEQVVLALADKGEDFALSAEHEGLQIATKYDINAANAEDYFSGDFSGGPADVECRYIVGRMFCKFVSGQYGSTFMHDYIAEAVRAEYFYPVKSAYFNQADLEWHISAMKQIFGDDIFKEFGAWYAEQVRIYKLNQ